MNFRTIIQLQPARNKINYSSELMLIGSCFSENISLKLTYFKFRTFSNPFGILFHPKALEKLITKAIKLEEYTEKDVFHFNDLWHSFDTHSDLSSVEKEALLTNLNDTIHTTHNEINKATHVLITLGTAWVYRFIETDTIVGNCHKVPQKKFAKELLTIDDIEASLEAIITLIRAVNSKVNILFTVSPVRHLKDGFVANQRSKAHLISAVHQVVDQNMANVSYFPSYEIMMDDLRDYRFYKSDLLHPNKLGIQYIWEQFRDVWIDENAIQTMKDVDAVQKGLAHKPFNPNSEQYQHFLIELQRKKQLLETKLGIAF